MEMDPDVSKYRNCMIEVRGRLQFVDAVGTGMFPAISELFGKEIVFLQFRKILEVIAFGSLIADRAAYSLAYKEFATEWNATKVLTNMEQINPEFYPVAMPPPVQAADGSRRFHFPSPLRGGFLSKSEFVRLYHICGGIIHSRNPFTTKDPIIKMPYSAAGWLGRIQKLLEWHRIRMVNGDVLVANVPMEGNIEVFRGSPR